MGPPFVVQPYLSRGTASPCVARTVLQTSDLVQAFRLTEQQRKAAIEVSQEVMLRLAACLDQSDSVVAQVEAGRQELAARDLSAATSGPALQLPAVVDLRQRVEAFLYAGKGALRDIGTLFEVFYEQKFEHKFQKAREWLGRTYGADDPLLHALQEDAEWIERILDMRNEVDHPSRPNRLIIENFTLSALQHKVVVSEPTWQLHGTPRSAIARDMPVLVDNLLTLFEDILTDSLLKVDPGGPFTVWEIPPAERQPEMPIRFRVGLARPIATDEA